MGQIGGYLLVIALISAISAVFIKLGVKLIANQQVEFNTPFWVSLISFFASLFTLTLMGNVGSKSSFIKVLMPLFVFFLACWLLNAQFIKYEEDEEPLGWSKSLLVTMFQCVSLFAFSLIFLILIAIVISMGMSPK